MSDIGEEFIRADANVEPSRVKKPLRSLLVLHTTNASVALRNRWDKPLIVSLFLSFFLFLNILND